MDASTFAVGRVTIRSGAGGAAVALRLRAASELQAAELTPAGLPPAAVLVVRRLADPMPRRFRAAHRRPRPEWERAVRGALAAQARSAARPDAHGRLDPSATAVLFDDEAQAIACLIVDRAHGGAASAWWWASLLPRLNLPPAAAVSAPRDPAAILVTRAREAPAVLATVVRWGEAAAIARALSAKGATAALQSLAREHGVPFAVIAEQPEAMADLSAARGGRTERAAAREWPTAAWARWVPSAIAGAGVIQEVQRLFGVALCVHESPAHLRTSAAASRRQPSAVIDRATVDRAATGAATIAAVRDSREHRRSPDAARESARPGQAAPAETTPKFLATPATRTETISSGAPAARAPEDVMASRHDASRPPAPDDNAPPLLAATVEATSDVAAAPEPLQGTGVALPCARVLKHRSPAITKGNTVEELATAVARPFSVLATEGVPTRLGGVFYLIHALDCLHLPAAFERGWRLDSSAGAWGTLDLIARALLGATWPARDPVWDAFAHLAGWNPSRDARAGGRYRSTLAASAADPAWPAPATWPAELRDPLDRILWSTAGSRVWLWSAAGYVLTHRRARGEHATAARRACRLLEAAGGARATLVWRPQRQIPWMPPAALSAGCPARLGRWAAAAAPAVLRRLRLAIGSEGCRRGDWLRIPARLYVTTSHVDVVFALRDIDLRVRRGGLDRDPGWKPAYGRVVSFHFE
jgi:hypothetical protein